jgi:hypothetical protein
MSGVTNDCGRRVVAGLAVTARLNARAAPPVAVKRILTANDDAAVVAAPPPHRRAGDRLPSRVRLCPTRETDTRRARTNWTKRRLAALSVLTLAAGTAFAVTISTPPLPELAPTTTLLVDDAGDFAPILPEAATDGSVLVASAIGGTVVFELDGSSWTRTAQLSGAGGRPWVGGGTVVVGGTVYGKGSDGAWKREGFVPWHTWAAVDGGTIIVEGLAYERDAQWAQTATLMTDDGLLPRGPWALYGDTAVALSGGVAYVFGRQPGSTTWMQRARLAPGDIAPRFDKGVSLTADRLAIGAGDGVHVYAFTDGRWMQEALLHWSFGALHLSGSTLVAGRDVFRLIDGDWIARGYMPFASGSSFEFGGAIAVEGVAKHELLTRTVAHRGGYVDRLVWDYDYIMDEWRWMWTWVWDPDRVWTSEEPYYANRSYVQVFDLANLPSLLAPVTVEFSPRTATAGTRVTVTATGTSLGVKRGRVLVIRGNKKALALRVTRWEESVAEGVVTRPLPAGSYDVCVEERGGERVVEPDGLRFVAPGIGSVAPTGGAGKTDVVATCTALGTKKGAVFLQARGAGKRIRCRVLAWPRDATSGTGQGEMRFRVPGKLAAGTVYDVVVVNKVGEGRAVRAFTATP